MLAPNPSMLDAIDEAIIAIEHDSDRRTDSDNAFAAACVARLRNLYDALCELDLIPDHEEDL